jgi:hypothetical protein
VRGSFARQGVMSLIGAEMGALAPAIAKSACPSATT